MQLPNFLKKFSPKATRKPTYLLTLILRDEEIKASVYEELAGKMTLIGSSVEKLSILIDELDLQELLETADRAIGMAEEKLPETVQATKTIFGINESWQKEGKILREHLENLRRLKEDLELEPLGFVVIPEAVAYFLQTEEGAPINALIIELGERIMTVSLIRASSVVESKRVQITQDSIPALIEKTLKGFSQFDVLPSRMVLFDGEEGLEEVKQACISFSWTKSLPFLHVPRIEILPQGVEAKAVVLGIANEMGLQFGDGVKSPPQQVLESEEKALPVEEESLAFGFLKEEDYGQKEKEEVAKAPSVPQKAIAIEKKWGFERLKKFWQELNIPDVPSFSLAALPMPGGLSKFFILLLLIPILLLTLSIGTYLLFTKATVEVLAKPKIVEIDKDITIDPSLTAPDPKGEKVKGQAVSVIKEGSKIGNATGKKDVGDKAKGEVKIGNRTEFAKTFPKATLLVGPNSLKFALLDTTNIASPAPGSFDIPSVKAQVEAVQIGEESNLPANTNFSFADYPTSSYFAKNEAPFVGGSKRELLVVAKLDQDTLFATLSATLKEQGLRELSDTNSKLTIIDITKEKVVEKKFDRKIDEEVKTFSLTVKVEYQAIGYEQDELKKFFVTALQEKNSSSDFTLSKSGPEFTIKSFDKKKDGRIIAKVHAKAVFMPNLDLEKVKTNLTFKSQNDAISFVKTLPNVGGARVSISLPLPLFPKRLPILGKNIMVVIKTE